jgi:hypothetical protein
VDDPGVGIGGGAISDKCSGDIDPFSDSSVLGAESDEEGSFLLAGLDCEGSMISLRAWAVIDPFFDRFGLTIGDCLTERVARGLDRDFLLAFLDKLPELFEAEIESTIISIGELVVAESLWS